MAETCLPRKDKGDVVTQRQKLWIFTAALIALAFCGPHKAAAGLRGDVCCYIRHKAPVNLTTASTIAAALVAGAKNISCRRAGDSREEILWLSLLVGIAQTESGFVPTARSSKDALGIMQIHWPTWGTKLQHYGFGKESLFNPTVNVLCGAAIFSDYLFDSQGNIVAALYAYYGAPDPRYAKKVIRCAVAFASTEKRKELQR